MRIELPTQAYLKECFDYDADLGALIWKKRPLKHFKSEGGQKQFNTKFAGSIAGSPHKGKGGVYMRVVIRVYGRRIQPRLHNVIWAWHTGDRFWGDLEVDHIDGNTLNNRIENLRLVTTSQNQKNTKRQSNNTSGLMGVVKNKDGWAVRAHYNKERIHLGRFTDFFEACCVRKSAELKYGYSPTHGRAL